jgi:hypothetical protein
VTAFATDPTAVVTPLTAPQMLAGFMCGTLDIGKINWAFQQLFKGATPTSGAAVPVAAPGANDSVFYINTLTNPDTLYYWDGTVWQQISGTSAAPTSGAGVPVAAPAVGASSFYINTLTNPDTLFFWDGTAWVSLATAYVENYAHAPLLASGVATRINPLVMTRGAVANTATFSALTNCTATLDTDGNHIVTVGPAGCVTGVWSYSYTVTCGGVPCTAIVSGKTLSGTVNHNFAIVAAAADVADVTITTADGSAVTINWGTGAPVVVASGVSASHTYVGAFSGNVTVTYSVCTTITGFTSTLGGWTGPLSALPSTLTSYNNTGSNTTSGSVASLPVGLTTYQNTGSNTTSGSVASLPAGLTFYNNEGNNTTSGSVASLPAGLTFYQSTGSNTTTGSVASLPVGLTYYANTGSNTTSGSVASLPAGLTNYANQGNNTTSGSIASLPAGLTAYVNTGSNTTSGSVASLPVGLTYYNNEGNNTTSGSVASLPAGLTFYNNQGNNTVTATSSAWAGTVPMDTFRNKGVALPSANVDFMLQAVANVPSWIGSRLVDVAGVNGAAGPAGIAAGLVIMSRGALVVNYN